MNRLAMIVGSTALLVGMGGVAGAGDVKLLKQPSEFPLVISAPGSYRLRGNITVPDANTTAIQVDADNVTLDLNGYTISGPTVCAAPPANNPLTCTPAAGTGYGIKSDHVGLTIVNGTIQGMGAQGIYLNPGYNSRIERLRLVDNGGGGVEVDGGGILSGNIVQRNGFTGIMANTDAVISGNMVLENGTYGIAAWKSTVTGNTVLRNNLGIYDSFGGTVVGNTVTDNFGLGLAAGCAGFNTGFAQNTFYGNNGGNGNLQVQCGVNMGQNVCGTGLCP